jgi:hypothetical protein
MFPMTLHLTTALVDGSRRVLTRTGAVLFVLLLVLQTLLVTSLNTVLAAEIPSAAADVLGLTLPVSGPVAGAILAGTTLSNAVYFVVLSRAFARPLPELASFPAALYTRRMGRASLTMLVAGVVSFLAIMIGFALLFLPGLFLSACLLFVVFAVGVEDRGVLGALKRSWQLSKGNRLRLGVIVFLTGVGGALIGVVPGLFQLAGAAAAGDLATIGLNSVLFTFVYGIVADAYRQLTDDTADLGGGGTATTAGTDRTPEL